MRSVRRAKALSFHKILGRASYRIVTDKHRFRQNTLVRLADSYVVV